MSDGQQHYDTGMHGTGENTTPEEQAYFEGRAESEKLVNALRARIAELERLPNYQQQMEAAMRLAAEARQSGDAGRLLEFILCGPGLEASAVTDEQCDAIHRVCVDWFFNGTTRNNGKVRRNEAIRAALQEDKQGG